MAYTPYTPYMPLVLYMYRASLHVYKVEHSAYSLRPLEAASQLQQEQSTYKETINFFSPKKARALAVTNNYNIHVRT